jgi:hypothetical protein
MRTYEERSTTVRKPNGRFRRNGKTATAAMNSIDSTREISMPVG